MYTHLQSKALNPKPQIQSRTSDLLYTQDDADSSVEEGLPEKEKADLRQTFFFRPLGV